MKSIFLFLCISLINGLNVLSQDLTREESRDLTWIVYDFFYHSPISQRNVNKNTGKSERLIFLLKINQDSKISDVSVLADNNNIDSGYAILSKLSSKEFEGWKSKSVKNKLIILPVVVINSDNNYMDIIDFLIQFGKLGQSPNMINLSGIEFRWPIRRKED
jgi:hypothetical protein